MVYSSSRSAVGLLQAETSKHQRSAAVVTWTVYMGTADFLRYAQDRPFAVLRTSLRRGTIIVHLWPLV